MSAQVRRIAILVTSLDSAAGRQLLLAMPSQLARDVRKAMASLSSVDPEEQRQVLAEFRKQAISTNASHTAKALTADTSAADRAPSASLVSVPRQSTQGGGDLAQGQASDESHHYTSHATDKHEDDLSGPQAEGVRPWAQLDVAALTDLLRGERPLVIAVVLSQLQPRHAARLLEQFPRQQHRAVIAHLTNLGDIDPAAMQAIDEHLASRIADYHHRRDSQSESTGRMQELLAAASPELRGHWQEIIADSDHQLAKRLGIAVSVPSAPAQADVAARSMSQAAAAEHAAAPRTSLLDMLANNVMTTADAQMSPHTASSAESEPVVLPFPTSAQTAQRSTSTPATAAQESGHEITTLDQILELPPRTIARVLSAADGEVLLLALAGATPGFMQRFTNMLEKQDARVLQARLSRLGAINLQDVDEAQRRLCELASHIVGQMRARRPAPSPARAAA